MTPRSLVLALLLALLAPAVAVRRRGRGAARGDARARSVRTGRRFVLYGGLGARDRGVEVLLADGRRLRATTAAVPRSLGVDARVIAMVVPPRAAVRAVLVRRARSTLRLPAPLPPAVGQCGYGFELPEF